MHLNGAYHSDFHQGILWYLRELDNSLHYKTISTVYQQNVKKLDEVNLKRADFIICVDEDITRTY